ncbi:MAG: sugar ABC transporter permease [Bacteroidetes bacterium]|jgi:multiple sugar transport system permease protein|nr:sugar ABC transporter permease [Bacteroidota bacterium]
MRPAPGHRRSQTAAAWLFLAPALTAIGIFFVIPVLGALVLSFTDFDIYALADLGMVRFVGMENYLRILDTPLFWTALKNTFYFVLVGGPLSVAVSLGTALMLNSKLARFKTLFRTIYFLPVVTSLVAVAVVWRYLYHPADGLLNHLLSWFGIGMIDWLGDPTYAMPAIILMAVWKNFGYNMLIFIAGLQNIPDDLYEAAHLDGAGWWRQFVDITLPMLAPTTVFVVMITVIGYFQLFAEPYVMTQGGPLYATTSVVLLMYEQGFRWWNMGHAAAIAFILFAIILIFTLAQIALQRRTGQ